MRKLQSYIARYGPEVGPRFYHVLQSQAAHAGVAARLRRKIEALRERGDRPLPLFPEGPEVAETGVISPDESRLAPQAGR